MNRSFCVAPMMRRTDRHFRFLCSLFSKEAILFTEMVHANAINRNSPDRFLSNIKVSNPTVLQLGGSNPEELGKATLASNAYDYSEINLNLGCPSPKVQSGNFGAILMKDVLTVKNCLQEMMVSTNKEVTVKIRLGVDDYDTENYLDNFIYELSKVGVKTFYVHARIALLKGLGPKDNRTIPPLNYERVLRLNSDFKNLDFVVNGGIDNFHNVKEYFKDLKGIMVGREVYENPIKLMDIDKIYYNSKKMPKDLFQIVDQMFHYIGSLDNKKDQETSKHHMINLFKGLVNAKKARILLLNEKNNQILKKNLMGILNENLIRAA
ncbi:MAG: tRNA dihydrouridine(20/20a) synthase DusA [Gammaproteobacteria bacterium TMED159]|nr:MAG: tRNA dihydrouridine(20/20a) synthase DusA [Gammaproteobacteria bacterium TMED159]